MLYKLIDISCLEVRDDARTVDEKHVLALILSIKENGFTSVITVRPIGNPDDGKYEIINGQHRFLAVKNLELKTISCKVVKLSDVQAELMMIEDNIIHNSLSPVWEVIAYTRSARLHHKLYPDTRPGVAGGKKRQKTDISANDILSFAEITAQRLGKDRRTVQRILQIGKKIPIDDLKRLGGTCLDQKAQLARLMTMPSEDREAEIQKAARGEKFALPAVTSAKKNKTGEPVDDKDPANARKPEVADSDPARNPAAGDEKENSPSDAERGMGQQADSGPDPEDGDERPKDENIDLGKRDQVSPNQSEVNSKLTDSSETNAVDPDHASIPHKPSDELPKRCKESYLNFLENGVREAKQYDKERCITCLEEAKQGKYNEDVVKDYLEKLGVYIGQNTIKAMRNTAVERAGG